VAGGVGGEEAGVSHEQAGVAALDVGLEEAHAAAAHIFQQVAEGD
jgi:hypothetical protein